MNKQRRLGRGLEALLGRGSGPIKPQIHVPPEEDSEESKDGNKVTPIEVNQQRSAGVTPRRIEPVRRPEETPHSEKRDANSATKDESRKEVSTIAAAALKSSSGDPSQPDHVLSDITKSNTSGGSSSSLGPPSGGTDTLLHVDIQLIETNPFQPRKDFSEEELKKLSESIEEHGLLQPLLVRRVDESYQLIAGERRLRAAQTAGWQEVPVKVVEAEDRKMSELALVENLQRQDLNAMEKAASFKQYIKTVGCTQEELAKRLKLDRSTVANLIRLLELPEPVKEAVRQNRITQGHARALLTLGDEPKQIEFAQRVEREGLSVRATERLVQDTVDQLDREPLAVVGRDGGKRPANDRDAQIAALEQEFRSALGMKVKLTHNARGRGKLTVQFANHEEFERLRKHVLGTDQKATQQRAG